MNVLTICTDYLPNVGGISNHIFYLNKYLLLNGINATILHVVQNSKEEHLYLEKVDIQDNIVYRLHLKDNLSKFKKIRYKPIIKSIIEKNFKYIDVIHTHEFKTVEFLIPDGYTWIWTIHSSQFFAFLFSKNIYDKLIYYIIKRKMKKVKTVITVSHLLKKAVEDRFSNVNVVSIPNGIELERYKCDDNKFKLPKDKYKVLISARWSEVKGIHVVLSFIERIKNNNIFKDFLFIFAGSDTFDDEGYYMAQQATVKNLNNCVLLGNVNKDDMPSLYQSCDYVLIASLFENFPLAALEAMAAKTIVIATNIGGIPEIIKHKESGFLFEKGNIKEIERCFLEILALSEEQKDEIKNIAYTTVGNLYSWDKIAKKTIQIYEE